MNEVYLVAGPATVGDTLRLFGRDVPAGKVALCRHGAYANGGHGPSQVMERLFPTQAAARQAASESGYDLPDPDGWW